MYFSFQNWAKKMLFKNSVFIDRYILLNSTIRGYNFRIRFFPKFVSNFLKCYVYIVENVRRNISLLENISTFYGF